MSGRLSTLGSAEDPSGSWARRAAIADEATRARQRAESVRRVNAAFIAAKRIPGRCDPESPSTRSQLVQNLPAEPLADPDVGPGGGASRAVPATMTSR